MENSFLNYAVSEQVVITGMGACSAGGEDLPTLWKHVMDGRVLTTSQELPRTFSQVPVYRAPTPLFSGKDRALARNADRSSQLALAAAREAWTASHLGLGEISPERLGVIIGSARGPTALQEKNASSSVSMPSASLYSSFSSTAGMISNALHAEGPAMMVSSSCTSGATALHLAAQLIRSGMLDAVIVGATEAPLLESILEQYKATGILAQNQKLAPFDQDRSGTILGEGAAFLILESVASAARRGAAIVGKLESISVATQSRHRVGLDRSGLSLKKVLQRSLQEAKLLPQEISLLHLHGTGTKLNDLLESQAVASLFGKAQDQPYSCATKAITGHTLGAAALFQVVLTLCALRDGIIPKITNCTTLDPACPLRVAAPSNIMHPLSKALCLTSGFWGNVSSVVLSVQK